MGVVVWEIFERGLTYKMRGEIIITRHDTTRLENNILYNAKDIY